MLSKFQVTTEVLESQSFWSDCFLVLTAIKPELKKGTSLILSNKKKNLLEVLSKGIEDPVPEINLLVCEVIAELSKNAPPQLLKPIAHFLIKLVKKKEIVSKYVGNSHGQFDSVLSIYTDIAESDPKVFDDIIVELITIGAEEFCKSDVLSTTQKLAYLDVLALIASHNQQKLIKHIEKVKAIVDSYIFVLYHHEELQDDGWLSNEVSFLIIG